MGVLTLAALLAATPLGVGCGGGDDDGSERAVKWWVEPPVGPNWARTRAVIEGCSPDLPLLEEPIIEYKGNRVYIELRHTPKDGKGICFLNLPIASKKITFERDLDELVLFDASTDPPEKRWPPVRPCHLRGDCRQLNRALRKAMGALLQKQLWPRSQEEISVKEFVVENGQAARGRLSLKGNT